MTSLGSSLCTFGVKVRRDSWRADFGPLYQEEASLRSSPQLIRLHWLATRRLACVELLFTCHRYGNLSCSHRNQTRQLQPKDGHEGNHKYGKHSYGREDARHLAFHNTLSIVRSRLPAMIHDVIGKK